MGHEQGERIGRIVGQMSLVGRMDELSDLEKLGERDHSNKLGDLDNLKMDWSKLLSKSNEPSKLETPSRANVSS